jgi:hypothetical protein
MSGENRDNIQNLIKYIHLPVKRLYIDHSTTMDIIAYVVVKPFNLSDSTTFFFKYWLCRNPHLNNKNNPGILVKVMH